MARILVVYSTTDGHTKTICERLALQLEADVDHVTLLPIEQAHAVALPTFDKVVVGASIRYGRHSALLRRFADANAGVLNAMPTAFFSVNLVARKPDKDRAGTNPYVRKFRSQTRWRPRIVDVFAGRLDYPRYRWTDRLVIRLIMLATSGPTDPRRVVEFTDWQRVRAFARQVAMM